MNEYKEQIILFGKNSGQNLKTIWDQDKEYVYWLYRTFKDKNNDLINKICELVDNHIDYSTLIILEKAVEEAIIDVLIVENVAIIEFEKNL